MTDVPEITVIACTNKLGGIDLIKGSLMNQDFNLGKVQLLLLDDFYHLRKKEVAEYMADVPFSYVHTYSPERVFNLAAKFNVALTLAEGELIVPLEDYEWADPTWLSTHYNTWKEKGPNVTVHGVTHNCEMPPTKFGDKIQDVRRILLPEERMRYALLSVFPKNEFNPKDLKVTEYDWRWREKFGVKPGNEIPPFTTHIYRNVSLPLERFLELNGYDEGFDGDEPKHFQIDPTAEVYWRAEVQGHRFLYLEEGPLYHLDHWALFSWDRQADYSYMRFRMHMIATHQQPVVAQNFNHPHLKVMRELNWRTSRARRILLGKLKDNCQFTLDEEGDSDAAITASVYRKARAYLDGIKGWILDMGCGSGEGMIGLEQGVGIDISREALQEARERGCQVIVGDVRRLPFANEVFDAIMSIETLEHMVEGDQYMDEAKRVLKPGGRLALSTPDGGPIIGSHLRTYTRKELVELIRAHLQPEHLEIVDWRSDIGCEDKLFLRAVK